MSWFKRHKENITTSTTEKKDAPEGIWHKCPSCKAPTRAKVLEENLFVCPECDYHNRIGSEEYFKILFNKGKHELLFKHLKPKDFLGFKDLKEYDKRLEDMQKKTGLTDAMQVGTGKMNKKDVVIACMNFHFIGGSMGSVVGEKIARAIDYCLEHKMPLIIISKSGGARMMESAFSLMQMAKTSAKLTQMAEAKLPYISLMTDPTTGGVTASFAMLGDINIAEPDALIGFAGPRVIKETIKRDLPPGFQRSEFLLEHGFLDFIVHRKELQQKLSSILWMFEN